MFVALALPCVWVGNKVTGAYPRSSRTSHTDCNAWALLLLRFGGDVTTCKCLHVALMTQLRNTHHLQLSHLYCGFWTKASKATPPHLSWYHTLPPPVYFPVFFSSCLFILWQHSLATSDTTFGFPDFFPVGQLGNSSQGRLWKGHKTHLRHSWNYCLWPQDTQRLREANSSVTGRPDLSVVSGSTT